MATPKKKVTSSSDRSKRAASSKAVVSGKTASSRANRQKVSTAKVSESGKGVTPGSAKVTRSGGAKKPSAPSMASAARGLASTVGRTALKVGLAAKVLDAGKVADGGLKGKPVRPAAKASKPEMATKADFGKSFKAARAQKSKQFMFKGKRYTTKRKDGK